MEYHSVLANFTLPLILLVIEFAVIGVLVFTALILLILSFLIAGSEVAFFSLNQKDINSLKTRQQPSFRRIVTLLEQPKTLLASMLITNSLVNLGIILIANILIDEWLLVYNLALWTQFLIKVLAVTITILLFVEVLPKVWATHNKIGFAASSSLVVEIFNSIFYRLSKRVVKFTDRLEKKISPDKSNSPDAGSLDEAIDLLPDNEATIEEKKILKGIRKFADTPVKQIMRTRLDVSGIEYNTGFKALIRTIEELHYSRLPVYKNNLDEIAGMLHTKDLLPHIDELEDYDWHSLTRPAFFVHEQKLIEDLLQEFRATRIHFAIVVDEFGGTSGIVTLEDIMEEITGEIKDEFDDEESVNKKIDDFTYIFEGKLMINDACKAMGITIDSFDAVRGESDSVAGLVLEIAGEFPQVNEVLQSGIYSFIPLEINKNRIDKVRVVIEPATDV
ncbi:MAG: gliding motility-associated protein GldE [Ferruginibacter sp.]